MNWELIKKLQDGQALSVEETLRLDEALESSASSAALLHSLGDSAPSLTWRSELNQKLASVSKKSRRQSSFRWLSGFAAAATVVFVGFLAVPKAEQDTNPRQATSMARRSEATNIEESLVKAHFEADVESGLGMATVQTEPTAGS